MKSNTMVIREKQIWQERRFLHKIPFRTPKKLQVVFENATFEFFKIFKKLEQLQPPRKSHWITNRIVLKFPYLTVRLSLAVCEITIHSHLEWDTVYSKNYQQLVSHSHHQHRFVSTKVNDRSNMCCITPPLRRLYFDIIH